MKTLICCMLFLLPAFAQDRAQAVIEVKHADPFELFTTLKQLRPSDNLLITQSHSNIILSGPKDQVSTLEEIAKKLDVPQVPPRDIELTVYLIYASHQTSEAAHLPPDLDAVLRQFANVFTYKGYRLMDSFVLRAREKNNSQLDCHGFFPDATGNRAGTTASYTFRVGEALLLNDQIRLNRLTFELHIPRQDGLSFDDARIGTDLDIRPGQKVVVGKAAAADGPDSAVILVISGKIVP